MAAIHFGVGLKDEKFEVWAEVVYCYSRAAKHDDRVVVSLFGVLGGFIS
jgi:hypothetical protein